jgi:creatine kinase
LKVQETLKNIFETKFKDELKGTYYALGDLNPQETQFLRENGFLFQMPSKRNCLYFSGAARDWPEGRGIFHNKNKTFLAWVNEEDHCRLISMSKDGDVLNVFSRFCKAAAIFSQNAEIMRSDALGFIGTCPSNLGTGLRASVMVVLPKFTESVELLESACASLDLQPRGSTGEHTAAVGGKWDISNKRRIGFSEVQLVQIMVDGVRQIINWEEMLVDGQQKEVKRQIWEIKGKWREPLRDAPLNENGA